MINLYSPHTTSGFTCNLLQLLVLITMCNEFSRMSFKFKKTITTVKKIFFVTVGIWKMGLGLDEL